MTQADLRRAPSRAALETVAQAIQPGSRVGEVKRLRGGISSGMHAVTLLGPGEARKRIVVRRYGDWWHEHNRSVVKREWTVLTALARAGAPAPRPLWLDEAGDTFGRMTMVTTCLPGRGLLAPRDLGSYVRQLAGAIFQVHQTPLTATERVLLPDQHADLLKLLDRNAPPERLARWPLGAGVWRALKHCPLPKSSAPGSLLHGDFWPGNTVWQRGKLTGVVDWEQPRIGNPAQDVGYCQVDLTHLFGLEAAQAFREAYEAAAGHPLPDLPFWELYAVSVALPEAENWVRGYHDLGRTDVTAEVARERLTLFAQAALARAGS